eukprot:CAMPEP_0184865646 /NCGR_PEP_ID=MMETSP0580-20130426/18726_1 /TAXON_ID=1118495 /ORGANISM="Dactyliosolen fragilissimus" /LENGTH=275 /DNA_ID=CAMNT_0027364929 /DNA_START=38 /DNA_END=862 /DNA_ORIENTATION=+
MMSSGKLPVQPDPQPSNDLQFVPSIDNSIQQNVQPIQQTQTQFQNQNQMQPQVQPVPPNEEKSYMTQLFQNSSHPIICIFHCLFKIGSLLVYLLGGFITNSHSQNSVTGANFITVTVICILLHAADFWVVKNITGRLLVGLRWWNNVLPDGTSTQWIYESAASSSSSTYRPNAFDATFFWMVLYLAPLTWMSVVFLGLVRLHFQWLIVSVMGLMLTGANVYGYWQCSRDQKEKFQNMLNRGAQMGASAAIKSNILGKISAFASGMSAGQSQGHGQ